jgi:predicted Ser/Thr protein kinase
MSEPVRVYALADELGITAPELLTWLSGHRMFDRAASSWLDGAESDAVRARFRAGEDERGLSVAQLARELQATEPLTMALVREHQPGIVAMNEYVQPVVAETLRSVLGTREPASSPRPSFMAAPPTAEILARVLGVAKGDLQARYSEAAGSGAAITRGAVFALVDEYLSSRMPAVGAAPAGNKELARALMLSPAELSDLLVSAGLSADVTQVPRSVLGAVLSAWLRLVRRSGRRKYQPSQFSIRDLRNAQPTREAQFGPSLQAGRSGSELHVLRSRPMALTSRLAEVAPVGGPLSAEDPPMLGDYELLARLGAGGMGTVYRARRVGTASEVALKTLADRLRNNDEATQRFNREVATLKAVGGDFTAKVIDVGSDGAATFIVMELLNGSSLEHIVDTRGPLSERHACALAVGLADALVSLQEGFIVHRDLKPANVMLTSAGPKLIDFGIAHLFEQPRLTDEGIQPGTLPYMAPEQFRGDAVESPVDVFAWAGTVLFAVSGSDPFPGLSRAAVMRAVLEDEPFGLSGMSDSIMRAILSRAFAKDPNNRPSARQVRDALSNGLTPSELRVDVRRTLQELFI